MTQLEQAGEPSMEDILASIRKIIAEDPPGSRALPEVRAEPAAPSVTNRIFQRMGEAVRSEQAKPAATPAAISEPYLRSSMPSLSSLPSGAPAAEAAKPFDTTAKPFDIDAQMAEVLSKTRGGAPRRDVEPSFGPTLPEVQAALDSLSLASNVPATPAPLSRPGFTVARDGFVPDAPINSPNNAQMNAQMNAPAKSPLHDPFEFSLGPSPFAARSGPQQSLATAMPEVRDTRFQDFGTLVPSRPFAGQSEAAETPVTATVAAKADEPNIEEPNIDQAHVDHANDIVAIAADVGEIPATSEVESAETKPDESVASNTPSPEAIAAQLKDFVTAVRPPSDVTPPEATPTAALVSVDTVLAELKSKLDLAAAYETEAAARVGEPEPVNVAAPVEAEIPAPESVPGPQVMPAPEPHSVTLAAATPAAPTTEGFDAEVVVARIIETPAADIVDIEEPAPIGAPAMMQEMVIAEPNSEGMRASSTSHSPSPFHAMQSSGMQSVAMPGSRSMEDTVAELLRPMLRNWLAENMPKIVERALRKEIDDSLHSEHKTAAE